ncbi:hypothetical protein N656DRAFT_769179 [Canariomyces notabilis]|uniref:Uncharacterized protein n=1 Tax=Canariomyces notabilis TaxID=2074819 RepID=A0AAN6YR68_9PEZI|nr:hypothetical protein N656DRAFT_769179 [Canariomyces arenarius]
MARQFRFVAVSNPTQAPSPESRKQDYSHAFRQAHAQRRRKQTERYRKGILLASGPVIKVLPQAASEEAPFSSPLSQVTVLNNNKDPFSSMARPLSSVEYFLLHHYIHVIIPSTLGHCSLFSSSSSSSDHPYPSPGTVESHKTQLLREWVGLAITDNDLMTAAVLLSTCRYIIQQVQPDKKPVFARLALQYKQTCLETLRQKVNNNTSAGGVRFGGNGMTAAFPPLPLPPGPGRGDG